MMGRGFLVGTMVVGVFSWAPLEQQWPMLVTVHQVYTDVLDAIAMAFFNGPW